MGEVLSFDKYHEIRKGDEIGTIIAKFLDRSDVSISSNSEDAPAIQSGSGAAYLEMHATLAILLSRRNVPIIVLNTDLDKAELVTIESTPLSTRLDWTAYYASRGAFFQRYHNAMNLEYGKRFANPVTEITLHGKGKLDFLIVPTAVVGLNVLTPLEYQNLNHMTATTQQAIHGLFYERGLELQESTLEWGKDPQSGQFLLTGELTPDTLFALEIQTGIVVSGVELAKRFQASSLE